MKYFIIILAFLLMSFAPATNRIADDCTCKSVKIWGRVKIVESFEDFHVKIVESFEDIRIDTSNYPTKCGQWQFVDYYEDFTIRFVDAHEDFSIKYDKHYPGIN